MALYQKVKQQLLEIIESSHKHEAIPSERELSVQLGVSRMTIRKAIDELVHNGYLYRKKNQGTFVADRSIMIDRQINDDLLFHKDDNKLIFFNIKPADDQLKTKLKLQPDTEIVRLIKVNYYQQKPINLEEICIVKQRVESLNYMEFTDLTAFNECKKLIEIQAVLIPPQYAKILEIDLHSLGLKIETIVLADSGEPMLLVNRYNISDNNVEIIFKGGG